MGAPPTSVDVEHLSEDLDRPGDTMLWPPHALLLDMWLLGSSLTSGSAGQGPLTTLRLRLGTCLTVWY